MEDKYFVQKVKLGEGTFGTVWRGIEKKSGEPVAVKMLDKAYVRQLKLKREDIELEIAIQQACCHNNITTLYDHFEDNHCMYLVLEYCDGGDFGDKALERSDMTEAEVAFWMKQVCDAVAALHSKDICHRDIKATNFMLRTERQGGNTLTENQQNTVLKLSDFGLATWAPKGQLLKRRCGTNFYMAPEVEQLPDRSKGYDQSVDVWSAGILMYVLMQGDKHPFHENGKMNSDRFAGGELDFWETPRTKSLACSCTRTSKGPLRMRFSEEARQLCTRMVQVNPVQRISSTAAAGAAETWCKNSPWTRLKADDDALRMTPVSRPLWQQMVSSVATAAALPVKLKEDDGKLFHEVTSALLALDIPQNVKGSSRMPLLEAERDQPGLQATPRMPAGTFDRLVTPRSSSERHSSRMEIPRETSCDDIMQVESLKEEVRTLRAALATPRSRHSISYELPEAGQDHEDAGGRSKQIEHITKQVDELKKEVDRKKKQQDLLIQQRENLEQHICQQEALVQAQAEQLLAENQRLRAELEARCSEEEDMAMQKKDLEAKVEQLTARSHRSAEEEERVRRVREELVQERQRLDREREQLRLWKEEIQEQQRQKEELRATPVAKPRLRMPSLRRNK